MPLIVCACQNFNSIVILNGDAIPINKKVLLYHDTQFKLSFTNSVVKKVILSITSFLDTILNVRNFT